jgi:hypothetical protein
MNNQSLTNLANKHILFMVSEDIVSWFNKYEVGIVRNNGSIIHPDMDDFLEKIFFVNHKTAIIELAELYGSMMVLFLFIDTVILT